MSATLNDDVQALKELVLHNPVSIRGIASATATTCLDIFPIVVIFLHWLCFMTVQVYCSPQDFKICGIVECRLLHKGQVLYLAMFVKGK